MRIIGCIYFISIFNLGDCDFISSQEEAVIRHLQETHEIKVAENEASEILDESSQRNEKQEQENNKIRAALGLPPVKTKSPKKLLNESENNKSRAALDLSPTKTKIPSKLSNEIDKNEQENNKLRAALGLPPMKAKVPAEKVVI